MLERRFDGRYWTSSLLIKVPLLRTVVGDGKTALNTLKFNKAGSQIATGSLDGRVSVLDLGEVDDMVLNRL